MNLGSNTVVSWSMTFSSLKSHFYFIVAVVNIQPVMVNIARSRRIYRSCQRLVPFVSRRYFSLAFCLGQLAFKSLSFLQMSFTHLPRSMNVHCGLAITVLLKDAPITLPEGFSSKAHRSPCQPTRQPSHPSQRSRARLPSTGQQE